MLFLRQNDVKVKWYQDINPPDINPRTKPPLTNPQRAKNSPDKTPQTNIPYELRTKFQVHFFEHISLPF